MRVALVTPVVPFPRPGFYRSIERVVDRLVWGLIRRGHDVRVLTTRWNGDGTAGGWDGVEVPCVDETLACYKRALGDGS